MNPDPRIRSDFQVEPADLAAPAGQLGKAYDDCTVALTAFHGTECYAWTMFGDPGVAQGTSPWLVDTLILDLA
jgi:hypothetical protein